MTFDPMSVEVTCVTLPKDHCVQVPWRYINVCGYSDQFCKLPHTYIHILRTYYVHTTYYVQNEWSHSLLLNSVQARQLLNSVQARQKGHVPILTFIFSLNWLTLTSKIHFVQFHLKVASYFLSWGKNKYVTLGMRLLLKYIRKSKLVYRK